MATTTDVELQTADAAIPLGVSVLNSDVTACMPLRLSAVVTDGNATEYVWTVTLVGGTEASNTTP